MKAANGSSDTLSSDSAEHSEQTPRFPAIRWLLFAPAGIVAYLLVIIVFVLARGVAGMADDRDPLPELFANALAACISSAVAIAVSPAHRTKIAVSWVALLFVVACYGNFIAGFITLAASIRNITVISVGGVLGCVAVKAWLGR